MVDEDYDPEGYHPFRPLGARGSGCYWCGMLEADDRHDVDEDDYTDRPVPVGGGRVIIARCEECGFSSSDLPLVQNHSCDVQENGGFHEDYPACGCEYGDCNGRKYGSTEAIMNTQRMLEARGYTDYEIDDIFDRMYH